MTKITKEFLWEIFDYKDGCLYWKKRLGYRTRVGSKAGSLKASGYFSTRINGIDIPNHRIIFFMHYGWFPEVVDHVNMNQTDNRLENLRPATKSENGKNAHLRSNNKSGYKNVSWHNEKSKWRVTIKNDGINKHIGYFKSIEEANAAATKARTEIHKEFARHA